MSQEITLIDLPSRGRCCCWSVNVWKTRLVLNYKKIPYKTEWVPYVRLQQTLKDTGVEPHPEGSFATYTVPVIKLADGTPIMDSLEIAHKLEALSPQPPLHLETGLHEEAQKAMGQAFGQLLPYFMPKLARSVIVDEDIDWFHADRSARFGMPLDDWEAQSGGDEAWEAAKPGFQRMAEVLTTHKRDEGPFIMGSTPCYGDFIFVAGIQMFRVVSEEAFERVVGHDLALRKVYEASKQWVERDDH